LPGKDEGSVGRQITVYQIARAFNTNIETSGRTNCSHRQLQLSSKRGDPGLGHGAIAAHSFFDPLPDLPADLSPVLLDSGFLLSDGGLPDR
jgi:hypothetical protein